MSYFMDQPEIDPDRQARRHALWGLGILACVAVIIGCLMLLLDGGGGGSRKPSNLNASISPRPTTSARSTPSQLASPTNSPTGSTASTAAARAGNPCSGASSCTVDGDGGVLTALNLYRTQHGRPVVAGTVTPGAQTCALHRGNGPTCKPHYIWTVASAQNGPQAVGKLTGFGSTWLLDAKVSSFAVGWAYSGGSYQCVLLKTLAGE